MTSRTLLLFAAVAASPAGFAQSPTAAPAAVAQAQPPVGEPPRLREVSVSATRTERDADDVPATVTTIKAEDIERGLVARHP